MILVQLIAALKPTATRTARRWLFHLGGVGLIPLGILDSSLIPIPGSMDFATALLSSRQGDLWLYYALMATAGSVAGGFLTYRLARKGGKETLERRFSSKQVNRVYKIFGRWGFSAVAIAALLPPPMPMVPFLLAAGALRYPVKKFLAALAVGRGVRYTVLAYLSAVYGRTVIEFIRRHAYPILCVSVGLVAVGVGAALLFAFLRRRKKTKAAP